MTIPPFDDYPELHWIPGTWIFFYPEPLMVFSITRTFRHDDWRLFPRINFCRYLQEKNK